MLAFRVPFAVLLTFLLFTGIAAVHPFSRSTTATVKIHDLFTLMSKKTAKGMRTTGPRSNPSLQHRFFEFLCKKFKFDMSEIDTVSTWNLVKSKLNKIHETHSKKRKSGGAKVTLKRSWAKENFDVGVFMKNSFGIRKHYEGAYKEEKSKNIQLVKKNEFLQKRIPMLQRMVRKLKRKQLGIRGRAQSRLHAAGLKQPSPRQFARRKASFVAAVRNALTFVGNSEFRVISLDYSDGRGKNHTINLTSSTPGSEREVVDLSDLELLNTIVFLKDTHMVSVAAYHAFSRTCSALPRSYKVRERIA